MGQLVLRYTTGLSDDQWEEQLRLAHPEYRKFR
jgi:hypothetical protein